MVKVLSGGTSSCHHMSVCLLVCLSIRPSVRPSIFHLSVCPSFRLFVFPPAGLPACPSVCLCVCQSIFSLSVSSSLLFSSIFFFLSLSSFLSLSPVCLSTFSVSSLCCHFSKTFTTDRQNRQSEKLRLS
jgi:hypothetical protein